MRFLRRKKFVVHKQMQLGLLLHSFLYVIVVVSIIGMTLFLPLAMELNNTEEYSEQTLQVADRILAKVREDLV